MGTQGDDSGGDDRLGIQSVEVAADILSALTEAGRAVPLKDLAQMTGMGAGKVHRYLISLVRTGIAVQEENGFYAIGPKAIALGLAGLRSLGPVKIAPQFLRRLRDETGETSVLMLWSERGPVVVDIEESARPIFMNIRAGSILPLATSAAGRVFASYLPEETQFNSDGRQTTIRDAFGRSGRKIMADTREKGLGIVDGLVVPGVSAMAAPVFDHKGLITAAIAFLARQEDVALSADHKARTLKAVAKDFSTRLGG